MGGDTGWTSFFRVGLGGGPLQPGVCPTVDDGATNAVLRHINIRAGGGGGAGGGVTQEGGAAEESSAPVPAGDEAGPAAKLHCLVLANPASPASAAGGAAGGAAAGGQEERQRAERVAAERLRVRLQALQQTWGARCDSFRVAACPPPRQHAHTRAREDNPLL